MKLMLLIGVLLIAQTWAKPQEQADEDNEAYEAEEEQQEEEEQERENGGYANPDERDPCLNHECETGKECDFGDDRVPTCVCAHKCVEETDKKLHVCSTTNVTFNSECELKRQKCLCQKTNDDRCLNKLYKHSQLDYFGECKEMAECSENQLADFPIRMRNWLFLIMEELADRKDLPPVGVKLAKKAKEEKEPWAIPVIWKFCDLDLSHDNVINGEELVPITAPLKAMEPCTGPFVSQCDENQDDKISPDEWGKCLGLDEVIKDEDKRQKTEEICTKLQRAQERAEKKNN